MSTDATVSYADKVNARFANKESHYVTLKQRFTDTVAQYPHNVQTTIRSALNMALLEFSRKYPTVKSFDQPGFRLCRAEKAPLSDVLIDVTMQRGLDIAWVISILEQFRPWQAMPIQVYKPMDDIHELDIQSPYASWDGQHTAVALWILATMIFRLDPRDVLVPVAIYEVDTKSEIRANFIRGNTSEGKKLLTKFEVITQQIYGVRVDGADDPYWKRVEEKQQLVEKAGLFFTDTDALDKDEVGAITQVNDITDIKVRLEVVKNFCRYGHRVINAMPRAINTKESPIIMKFFDMAHKEGIDYTDQEVDSLADLCIRLFYADFDARGPYWNRLGIAYNNWWNEHYCNVSEELRPTRPKLNKDISQGTTFFWHQLRKSWRSSNGTPMRMPKLSIHTLFVPTVEDLF